MRAVTALIGLALVATGCGDAGTGEPPVDTSNGAAEAERELAVTPDGITLVDAGGGASHHINFGVSEGMAERTVAAALGAPGEASSNAECPAGPMTMVRFGALTLNMVDGRFAGWSLDQREASDAAREGVTTVSGIGIGTTRGEIEEVGALELVEGSTLGTEFTSGNISGLLSGSGPDAVITDLWAGTACVFR